MKWMPLRCSVPPRLLLMVDTFPRVGDRMADKLTLNYKHFVECHWQIKVYCFACKATVCLNSTKMDTMQSDFISCAQNINEHVLCAYIFTAEISPEPGRLVPGCGTIDHQSRKVCQGLCRCCQGSSEHRVILLSLAVCYLSVHWLRGDNRGCVGVGAGIWRAGKKKKKTTWFFLELEA